MKKLITLLILFVGMVSSASAIDYYVSGDHRVLPSSSDWGIREENKMHATSVENVYALVVPSKDVTQGTDYLFKFVEKNGETETWYGYDGGGNTTLTFDASATYTIVFYYDASQHKGRFIATPMLRWDLGDSGNGNWSWNYEAASLFTNVDDFTWTYEILPSKFTKDTSFRLYSAAWNKSAYPSGTNVVPSYGGESSNSAYFNYVSSTDWCWRISKPTYTFEKVVLTATYKPFDSTNGADFGQWEVKADAYVTKTVRGDYKYATLGCPVPLDIVEANSVSAYPLTADASKGKITKGSAITTIPANEGALLENTTGSNQTIRAKVLASAASSASNDLHAYTGTGNITQPGSGSTYYILGVQDEHVGFYKVNPNPSGNAMGANTAYLSVSGVLAREFFAFDDGETTGIEAMKATQKMNGEYFNLAGQRVAQPTKGLYIVNGKKVIMK